MSILQRQERSLYYTGSETSTAVLKGVTGLAGIDITSLTASAGNTFTLRIVDGTASTGTQVFSSLNIGVGFRSMPSVRLGTGLYIDVDADASASATGIIYTVYYFKDLFH